MRPLVTWIVLFSLIASTPVAAGGNSWNRLRYSGGTVEAKVNPFDWNTTLTVTPDGLSLVFSGRKTVRIQASDVTGLSYGQEARRRVADLVALSVIATPLVLFGLLHQSQVHFVGIEFRGEDGKPGAVLLEADKGNYRAILQVLGSVTGQPVKNAP
ncbi:MAG: hypothetical protein ACE141_18235 [Bryobacteraceae bacterium]